MQRNVPAQNANAAPTQAGCEWARCPAPKKKSNGANRCHHGESKSHQPLGTPRCPAGDHQGADGERAKRLVQDDGQRGTQSERAVLGLIARRHGCGHGQSIENRVE